MQIDRVVLTTADLDAQAAYYERLGLLVSRSAEHLDVRVGAATLGFRRGPAPEQGRGHHIAFSVPTATIERAARWLADRVEVLSPANGSALVEGGAGWNSRSVYFVGPENSILEIIGRRDLDGSPPGASWDFGPADLLGISEVGIPCTDPGRVADTLAAAAGLRPFTPVTEQFLPVGDQHGLLILTHEERIWFPTDATRPARGPVEVHVRAPHAARLDVTENCAVIVDAAGLPEYLGPHLAA